MQWIGKKQTSKTWKVQFRAFTCNLANSRLAATGKARSSSWGGFFSLEMGAKTIWRWLLKQWGKFKIQSCKCEWIFGSVGAKKSKRYSGTFGSLAAHNLFIEASGNECVVFVDPKGSVWSIWRSASKQGNWHLCTMFSFQKHKWITNRFLCDNRNVHGSVRLNVRI